MKDSNSQGLGKEILLLGYHSGIWLALGAALVYLALV
jgi:hypothetical protein